MRWLILLLACAVCTACLPRVGDSVDAGGVVDEPDAGDGGADLDAGVTCQDGVLDGTETDLDCGGTCAPCGLTLACLGPRDCASGVCTAGHCAAPFQPCTPITFARCGTVGTPYLDLTSSTATTITFPAGGSDAYSLPCVRVRLGQSVTFQGTFQSHPVKQACGPVSGGVPTTSSGSSLTVVLDRALGTFGYYCTNHGSSSGSGMSGAIDVVR
jgi:plastocyanin